jgi:hypothetical protein
MPLEIYYTSAGTALPSVGDRMTIHRNGELVYESIVSRVYPDGSYDTMDLAEYLAHHVLCANKITSPPTVAVSSSPQPS